MLTARSEPPDRLQALRMGVDDYITKPFLQEELSTRLTSASFFCVFHKLL
jgi:DNA-binding response OmpR family regulator